MHSPDRSVRPPADLQIFVHPANWQWKSSFLVVGSCCYCCCCSTKGFCLECTYLGNKLMGWPSCFMALARSNKTQAISNIHFPSITILRTKNPSYYHLKEWKYKLARVPWNLKRFKGVIKLTALQTSTRRRLPWCSNCKSESSTLKGS